jgi:hypothetical protein
MASPIGRVRNECWALIFAYSLTGLSLSTLNSDWLARGTRQIMARIMETATAAAPTELVREKATRHLTQQTERAALVIERLLQHDLSSEEMPARRRAAVALVLLAASERWK